MSRKMLIVDDLPQGALPSYERDIAAKSYVIGQRGAVIAIEEDFDSTTKQIVKEYMNEWVNDECD